LEKRQESMSVFTRILTILIVVVLPGVQAACGGSSDEKQAEKEKTETVAATGKESTGALPLSSVPFATEIGDAGFKAVYYTKFPAAMAGEDGRMILYGSASGGKDGGMIFVQGSGATFKWVWHWYFEDMIPASIQRVELNQDGLWDIRLTPTKGKTIEFLQDDSFSLAAGQRGDRIALNGKSSESLPDFPLWFCFDNNHITVWKSLLNSEVFIDVASPFGLRDGILSITAGQTDQPRECVIKADGKEIQRFILEPTTDEQLIKLEPAARTASSIRLVVESCHGESRQVAIAELSIR
jgi:hypothetical protein